MLVGIGGDTPVGSTRGFVESLDVDTGASQWKWWTTPGPGEPGIETWPNPEASLRSSGAPWQPFTYDPELNLVYVTTGQATPTYNGKSREGANLYTCSVVALKADTGKMAWYYQFSPHDTHDWDAAEVAILIDGDDRRQAAQAAGAGQSQRLLLHARSRHRRAARDQAVRAVELISPRGRWQSGAESGEGGIARRHAGVSDVGRRGELSGAVVQPGHRPLLHERHRRRQHLLSVARSERSDGARPRAGMARRLLRLAADRDRLSQRRGEVGSIAIRNKAGARASSRASSRPAAAWCSPAIRRAT